MKKLIFLLGLLVPFALAQPELPEGPGVNLVYAKCQSCHPVDYVTSSAGLPESLWADTINLMQQLGMQVTPEEEEQLVEYLATYLGPNPPPEPSETAADESAADESASADEDASASSEGELTAQAATDVDGEAVYSSNCMSCHQGNGQGIANAFPPLVDHTPALYNADRDYLVDVLLYGLQGQIMVEDQSYQGVMPAWQQLSDDEIAAVLNYSLTSWENDADLSDDFMPYTAEQVAERRDQGLSAQDMYERRPDLSSSDSDSDADSAGEDADSEGAGEGEGE